MLANQPGLLRSGSFQSQSQSGGGQQSQGAGAPMGESSLFVPDPAAHWWPRELGAPSATGSQNNVRYAYFASACRLAVETNGPVNVLLPGRFRSGRSAHRHAVHGGLSECLGAGHVDAVLPVDAEGVRNVLQR
jgi:hypothetical protein